MQTYTGVAFDFTNIRPEDINLEDIAQSLSMQCRFNGHTDVFYSVANHSVLVSRIVPADAAAWGLLHDAAEAYVCDLPRPVKEHLRTFEWILGEKVWLGSRYDLLERNVAECIMERFGFDPEFGNIDKSVFDAVMYADNVLLATEKRDLMTAPCDRDWGELPQPMTQTIVPWSPNMARSRFLSRARELGIS
jgi:hypothetical protein